MASHIPLRSARARSNLQDACHTISTLPQPPHRSFVTSSQHYTPSTTLLALSTRKSNYSPTLAPKQTYRFDSTTATPTSATPQSPSTTSSQTILPPTSTLSWNDYFAHRRLRRRINLLSSITTSSFTTLVGISALQSVETDMLNTYSFGLDPMVVIGLATAGSAGVGWLTGPAVGNLGMRLRVGKERRREIDAKEKDFYARIRKYRVDPSNQSLANPLPDYYGEKIGSVTGYRHWLKDQRAYRRKRESL